MSRKPISSKMFKLSIKLFDLIRLKIFHFHNNWLYGIFTCWGLLLNVYSVLLPGSVVVKPKNTPKISIMLWNWWIICGSGCVQVHFVPQLAQIMHFLRLISSGYIFLLFFSSKGLQFIHYMLLHFHVNVNTFCWVKQLNRDHKSFLH